MGGVCVGGGGDTLPYDPNSLRFARFSGFLSLLHPLDKLGY